VSLRSKSETHDNVELCSTEFGFCDATDLLADMLAVVAPAGGQYQAGMALRGEAIGLVARELIGGRLSGYLVRMLSGTSMIVRGEGAMNTLLNSKAKLDTAFAGRKKFAPLAVKLAVEVNYADFLDGLALIGMKWKEETPSVTSSQSTAATG
jgi:hypothetical protein